MKLNVRLLLITIIIVFLISITSTLVFYSLSNKIISDQQSKTISNSTSDFIFVLQSNLQKTDEDFEKLIPALKTFDSIDLDSTAIDFLFTLEGDSLINTKEYKIKNGSGLNLVSKSFKRFFVDNPNIILKFSQPGNGKIYYYGNEITEQFLNRIAEKIRSEIALVINDSPVEVSNAQKNQALLPEIIETVRGLQYKNNFELYSSELSKYDFTASLFTPNYLLTPGAKIKFVIFQTFEDGVEFRTTLQTVMIIIILAGSALTFIIVLLLTAKMRRQISFLSDAAEITGRGILDHEVTVISKDELGRLGEAFNKMLGELRKNKKSEMEYSEFITLINQKPTLNEVSEAALSKIIKSTGLTFGVLYLTENKKLEIVSAFGISKNLVKSTSETDIYQNAIETKEKAEFVFTGNYPEIKTGLTTIKLQYLLLYPILYNKEVIAILELASESAPRVNVVTYIQNIQEQLAVGLINAKSFHQLEILVEDLRKLNDEYQKQNDQILKQNEKLKELHEQLSEKAVELEKQRLKAVELTMVKSQFLASMSHELRTPLISILGLTELMLKDLSSDVKSVERLNVVFRNGKRLLNLINNILEFSRFESGRIELKKDSFLIRDLVSEIEDSIRHLAVEKKLKLNIIIKDNKDYLVNTDKSKLEQILVNLLANAVKFTDKGSLTLAIRQEENAGLSFCVEDTGIGISEEHQKIIFSEFRQVDGSTSRKYGGAGLGLAICKKYIDLMGSRLTLESSMGAGSKFGFTLENVVLDVVDLSGSKFLGGAVEAKHPGRKQSALIINNDPDARKLLGGYLETYNYSVEFVSDGSEALRKIKTEIPSVVVADPYIDDPCVWTLIYDIKKNAETAGTTIIISAISSSEKIGWWLGFDDYLPTDFSKYQFVKTLEEINANRRIKIKNIVFWGTGRAEFERIKESSGPGLSVTKMKKTEADGAAFGNDVPDLLIIDLESLKEQSITAIDRLKHDRMTRYIPVVLTVGSSLNSKTLDKIKSTIASVTLANKYHPLDVLKIIKDRLRIEEADANEKAGLLESVTLQSAKTEQEIKSALRANAKPTVLIVDDDDDALFTIGEMLNEFDCEIMYAHNGSECLLTLNYIEPDLVLLDIMMPQMDGFETIKKIRNEKKFQKLPVIALTAYAMLDNKNVIEKNGFDGLITKPVNSAKLIQTIQQFIGVKSAR